MLFFCFVVPKWCPTLQNHAVTRYAVLFAEFKKTPISSGLAASAYETICRLMTANLAMRAIKNADETKEDQSDDQKTVWITFPSDADCIDTALLTLGVQSWKDCLIVERICAVPALASMITVDTDLLMINELTDAVKSLWDDGDLTMYKAALEYEQCLDCGLALDIALNLACYDFDGYCVSRTEYMKTKFCEGGINISDPAFAFFDFDGHGRRQIGNEGLGYTAYGSIRRNDQPFVRASAEPDSEMSMQL